jgi:hypothetical protein
MRTLSRLVVLSGVLVAAGLALSETALSTVQTTIRASVITIPPKVQSAGSTYRLRVRVTNLSATFTPLCVDFTDDNNSWLIEAPGLRAFDSDTFCAGTLLRGQTKTLTFFVIAAKQGAHRMTITIGKAKIFRSVNDAIIDDPDALFWESNFVIV